jgi:hypothetical protein
MKWILVVIMMNLTPMQQDRDLYILTQPVFSTAEECIYYAQVNKTYIMGLVKENYPEQEIEQAVCIKSEVLKDIIQPEEKKKGIDA